MKRVLHLIAQYPDRTGSGTYMKSILKQGNINGLRQAALYALNDGDEVDLCQYGLSGEYVVRFKTERLPFPVVGMSDNMPYESTRYSDMTEDMVESWKSAFLETIRVAVDEFKPDVIYSHHLWLLTALVASEIEGVSIRAFGHGTDIRQFKSHSMDTDYIVRGCRKLERIFALTEYQRGEIEGCYGISRDRIEVVGGGFDMDIFNVGDGDISEKKYKKKQLIYAGKLCKTKGLKSLIRVYGQIKADIGLILAGSGKSCEERELKSLARSVGGDIRFMGQVSQIELSKIFKLGDVFVLPSFYEGLALVNVEALASGLRVVSADIDGIRSYMGEEINNSGLIEYVELPRIDDRALPSERELLRYEERLKESIELQLAKRDKREDLGIYHKIYPSIVARSWREIFKKL